MVNDKWLMINDAKRIKSILNNNIETSIIYSRVLNTLFTISLVAISYTVGILSDKG